MEYAKRIRLIRAHKGFTQEYVADKLAISQAAYSKMERKAGNCSLLTLEKVADVLEVTLPFLVDIKNEHYT
jgi:transcriptional regulator with XRE-family HTH domain